METNTATTKREEDSPSSSLEREREDSTTNSSTSDEGLLMGRYEMGKLLGCGAFGKVYHARDARTGQSVAIKALSKRKLIRGGLAAQTKREVLIMRRLRHHNIVRLYEVLATRTKIFFVMEYAKGGELFTRVAKGRLREDPARSYFQQLISAVGYCHQRGVFHRDLKPENLLLDENGNLKVSDFGLSAISDQIRSDGLLHTLCGTPAYVAPEILAKKGYDGRKIDIWSCGIILYVLTAGYLPFNDPNLMVMYKKIYKGDFRCPRWMSPDLRRILGRLLDTNPETRITVSEIMNDPWFSRGFKGPVSLPDKEFFSGFKGDSEKSPLSLNAFDIISFSSGFDLRGLFEEDTGGWWRVVSEEDAEMVLERVKKVAEVVRFEVRKKGFALFLEGENGVEIGVEIFRLTDNMVVVEVSRMGGDGWKYEEFCRKRLKPALVDGPQNEEVAAASPEHADVGAGHSTMDQVPGS
ncbi:hypothetical protein AMTRI_Chr08g167680 [Amborella trichopoda]